MTDQKTLEPCPFCGKADTLTVTSASEFWDGEEDAPYMYTEAYAVMCDASSPNGPGGCGASSGFKPSQQEAVNLWNTRAARAQGEK